MRLQLIVSVVVLMLGFAPAPFSKREVVRGDLKAMQGTWVYHSGGKCQYIPNS
jgi:hypothetical protein